MQNKTDKQQKTVRLILDHSLFPRAPWMLIPGKQKGNPTVSVLGKKQKQKCTKKETNKKQQQHTKTNPTFPFICKIQVHQKSDTAHFYYQRAEDKRAVTKRTKKPKPANLTEGQVNGYWYLLRRTETEK